MGRLATDPRTGHFANGTPYTVVGIVQQASFMGNNFRLSDAYVPVGQWTDPTFLDRRVSMGMDAVARLKTGVTLVQARSDMDSVAQVLAKAYPDADKDTGITLVPLKQDMVGDVAPLLYVLLGAVGFVLLIACVNIASLLLARSTGRTRERGIRAALGASRVRVVRQLLTESILLAFTGGVLGILLAAWGTRASIRILPQALPRSGQVVLDAHVLLFTLGLSLFAGILFGLAPALKAFQSNLQETLREGGRGQRCTPPPAGRFRRRGNRAGAGTARGSRPDDPQPRAPLGRQSGFQSAPLALLLDRLSSGDDESASRSIAKSVAAVRCSS